jgi:hypothetical protein
MSNSENNSSSSMFTPGLFSVGVSGYSAYLAFNAAAANHFDSADKFLLAGTVFLGTYLACKVGGKLGASLGLLVGGLFGGAMGAGAGAAASVGDRASGLLGGGAVGAGVGAIVCAIGGGLTGFWGGAYLGHEYSEELAHRYIFNDKAVPQPETATEQPELSAYVPGTDIRFSVRPA